MPKKYRLNYLTKCHVAATVHSINASGQLPAIPLWLIKFHDNAYSYFFISGQIYRIISVYTLRAMILCKEVVRVPLVGIVLSVPGAGRRITFHPAPF